MREADGGGVILIDPQTLRRCATTLDDLAIDYGLYASSLSGMPMPLMPGPVIGTVEQGIAQATAILQSQHVLHDDAVELRSRALWTDFADAYADGYALSGSELRLFVAGLENGTLMQYAEPWQAELAGVWAGNTYRKTFADDPAKLVELSRILAGTARDKDFSVAFVSTFGGANLVKVPRVLQAMVYTDRLSGMDSPFDGLADTPLASRLAAQGYTLKEDPQNLLASFALALAVATSAADMTKRSSTLADEEDAIAQSPDSWAVAQLLTHQGVYGRRFLNQVFQRQLIPLVQRDSNGYMQSAMPVTVPGFSDGAQTDPKQIILSALARNGAAAADALSTPLDQPVRFITPYGPVETKDPMEILYRAYWTDHGQGFANVYTSATNYLQPPGEPAGTNAQGNALTWDLVQNVIGGGGPHPSALVPALARDLALHHWPAIYESAGAGGYEQSGSLMADNRLYLSAHDMRDVFQQIAGSDADGRFMGSEAHFQAAYIAENAREHPDDAYHWGYKVGAVNQMFLNAHDVQASVDLAHASERQKLFFGSIKETIGLLTEEAPPLHAAVSYAAEAFDHVGAPDAMSVADSNFDAKLETGATVRAMLATGFYEAGHFQAGPGAPPASLVPHGQLVDYAKLAPMADRHDPRLTFDTWAQEATAHDDAYRWAVVGSADGLGGREESVPLGG